MLSLRLENHSFEEVTLMFLNYYNNLVYTIVCLNTQFWLA